MYGFTTFAESSGTESCGSIPDISRDSEGNGKPKHDEDWTQLLEHTVPNHGRVSLDIDKVDMTPILEKARAGQDVGHDKNLHTFDGAEVVGLLSDPTICIEDMPLDLLHGAEVSR